MSHHAYFVAGEKEKGEKLALGYAESKLSLTDADNPDITLLRYTFFSIEDARKVTTLANQTPLIHDKKCIILVLDRFSVEAQNALLKIFEEPPASTVLVLVIPYAGLLLPTLRSRVLPIEATEEGNSQEPEAVRAFLKASKAEQTKLIAALIEKSKSDKEEVKQQARTDAVLLAEGLLKAAHTAYQKKNSPELLAFLEDMNRFMPLLHGRSAPLKLIFEHILITFPL